MLNIMDTKAYTDKAIAFVKELGIPVDYKPLPEEECFLPGLLIENGAIIIDAEKLKYPGDILHEAGHLAVLLPDERKTLMGIGIADRKDRSAEEMAAIAWSYAACVHLGIDPSFVFHGQGYQGGGEYIVENFSQGQFFGVPMLQYYGMSAEPHKATELGWPAYPKMKQWLRE